MTYETLTLSKVFINTVPWIGKLVGYYTPLKGEPEAVTVRDSLILIPSYKKLCNRMRLKSRPKTLHTQKLNDIYNEIISIYYVVCLKHAMTHMQST